MNMYFLIESDDDPSYPTTTIQGTFTLATYLVEILHGIRDSQVTFKGRKYRWNVLPMRL